MVQICTCGLLKVQKVGTSVEDGHKICNNCHRPLEFRAGMPLPSTDPSMIPEQMVTTLPTVPGYVVTKNLGLVTELSAASGWTATSKGNEALTDATAAFRRTAKSLGANAIVGVTASTFGARGGITNALGGDAVGVLLVGTAVTVAPRESSGQGGPDA